MVVRGLCDFWVEVRISILIGGWEELKIIKVKYCDIYNF